MNLYMKSTQNKMEIFQKTIEITKVVLGTNFEVKTSNILKGEEPEKTNKFLQAFYQAATSGKDFPKIINKFLEYKKKKEEDKKKQNKEDDKIPTTTGTQEKQAEKPVEKQVEKQIEKQSVKQSDKQSDKNEKFKKDLSLIKPETNQTTNKNIPDKSKSSLETQKSITQARPQTPSKKPSSIQSETKEIQEIKKTVDKAPQGLISDKNKAEIETIANGKESKELKIKSQKDDDLGSILSNTGKIKMESRISKFTDVTSGGNPREQEKSTGLTKTLNAADLELIKNYVQEISKNSNPIGKIIDFLEDDIDSMNKELQSWIKDSKNYRERLEEEVKKSDETLLPLQNELLELEETINDENMRIKSIKSRMIKNEQIIQNLIHNVISLKNDKNL